MAAPLGHLSRIIDALREGNGTCAELAVRCGLPTRAVTNALHDQAKTLTPQAFRTDRASNAPIWSMDKPVIRRPVSPLIGQKYAPQWRDSTERKPGDFWSARDLAMLSR